MNTRRQFLRAALGLAAGGVMAGCRVVAPVRPARPAAPTAPPRPTAVPGGLREPADRIGLRFGSAVPWMLFNGPLRQAMLDVFARDFNAATIHNGFYWTEWEPQEGQVSERAIDQSRREIAALRAIGITDLRGHPLIFPGYEPSWLAEGMRAGKYRKARLAEIVQQHVRQVMELFRADIREWVVVNEPYRFYGATQGDYFKLILGDEYVDLAFQTARETDPSATLLLNDWDNHGTRGLNGAPEGSSETVNRNKAIVERLKAKGLIDGIGLQVHVNAARPPQRQDMIDTLRAYGVPVHLTELDVNLKDVRGEPAQRFEKQAQVYVDVIEAALDSGVCESICVWEFGDRYSWLEQAWNQYGSLDADPTWLDDDLQPKPAYEAVRRALTARADR